MTSESNAVARPSEAAGHRASPRAAPWRRTAVALAAWSFIYAGYRAYYAAGGVLGLFGELVSPTQFRAINAVGAAIIVVAGVVPLIASKVDAVRRALPALCWIAAVGCCMHALVDGTLRVLSLTGVHPTVLPATVWRSFDRRAADVQDLLLNEPWFFIEGLLWASLGLAIVHPSRRRAWISSAVIACVMLSVVGVLSGLGVIGAFRVG